MSFTGHKLLFPSKQDLNKSLLCIENVYILLTKLQSVYYYQLLVLLLHLTGTTGAETQNLRHVFVPAGLVAMVTGD